MTGDRRQGTGEYRLSNARRPSSVYAHPSAVNARLRRVTPALQAILALTWALTPISLGAFAPATRFARVGVPASSSPLGYVSQLAPTPTPPPPDEPTAAEDPLLLPDLMTNPPAGLAIRRYGNGRVLRFTNAVWNDGQGPLELFGEPDPASGTIRVVQRAYTASGVVAEWPVGVFTFHPNHLHWHLDGFVVYELWSVDSGGDLDQLVTSSGKLSYCLIDSDVVDRDNPLRPSGRQYSGCGRARQGLSVGWGDTYLSYLDGQSLPLDDVPDGRYALVSAANANKALKEARISNNIGMVYVDISGYQLTVIPAQDIAMIRRLTEHSR